MRAQEQAKQHRIAIVLSTGPAARINDKGIRLWQAAFEELRRLGDVEGQNLTIERYSGEGRPEGFADLAREVVSRNPDVIVAVAGPITLAVDAATSTIPIVASGTFTSSESAEPGAPWRQSHRCQGRGVRDLWKAAADPQGSHTFGIQSRVPGYTHGLGRRLWAAGTR